jgi:phosphate transport system protein
MSDTTGPVRRAFTGALESIGTRVSRLFALVSESLAAATEAFLSGDREQAAAIAEHDKQIDQLEAEIETLIERTMLINAPVAGDFHRLVCALRIVPELERSGDLAEHIASRAATGVGGQLPPAIRGTIQELGDKVTAMWRDAAEAFAEGDHTAGDRLERADDEIDDLHRRLWGELAAADIPNEVAMEMALIARFYERLGDHAAHIAARLPQLRE